MGRVGLSVGGWFASEIITKLVYKAKNDEEQLSDRMVDMVNQLETLLPQILSVVDLAGKQLIIRDPRLTEWLRQLKDLAYEADDVLDDLEAKEQRGDRKQMSKKHDGLAADVDNFIKELLLSDTEEEASPLLLSDTEEEETSHLSLSDDKLFGKGKEKIGEKQMSKVSASASPLHKAVEDLSVSNEEVQKKFISILEKLHGIADDVGNFIEMLTQDTEEETRPSLPSCDKLFGRDGEIEAILDMLKLGPGSSTRIVPIVGFGGVGKTALARLIYDHVDTVREFEVRLWVSVSDNNNLKSLIEMILIEMMKHSLGTLPKSDAMTNFHCESTTLDFVQWRLAGLLKGKRFLIVLDDVWDDLGRIWEGLSSPLISNGGGSVVLVTTQSKIIAEKTGTVEPIVIDVLEGKDFLQLFEHYAFGDKTNIEAAKVKELKPVGRKIAEKLHGLPLAGKAVGSLLQSNLNRAYWGRFLKGEWWQFDSCLETILPSLGRGFQHLSPNLKQCFAYCSLFHRGYKFDKDMLVEMWMAHGYITPDELGIRRMKDVGIEWFDELTSKSFFQPYGNNQFKINDLMWELAICVSLEECFVLKDDSIEIPQGIRHLSVRTSELDVLFQDIDKLKGLRTILHDYYHVPEKFDPVLSCLLDKSTSLRVLGLPNCNMIKKTLPDGIDGLSYLRYMDLSNNNFEYLPETISKLFHLQFLNIQGYYFRSLPEGICKLVRLQQLRAHSNTLSLISYIGNLTSLEELMEFCVECKPGHQIVELEHLRELRGKLLIKNLENVATEEEAMKAMLINKGHLHSLHLSWSSSKTNSEAILEGLKPHCNLKELTISGYGGITSPTWLLDSQCLSNLQSVHLSLCDRWNSLPPLGQLQFLKFLHIEDMPSLRQVDGQRYGNAAVIFPSLEELVLEGLAECEWLGVEQGCQLFPCLRKLHIIRCTKLKNFPFLSLKSSVKEIVIRPCGDLGSDLPRCLLNLTSLSILRIEKYENESSLDLHNLTVLKQLELDGIRGPTIIQGLHSLTSLSRLSVSYCDKPILPPVTQKEEAADGSTAKDLTLRLASLTHLRIDAPFLINRGLDWIGKLPRLKVLVIEGSPLLKFGDDHNEWFRHLTSLQKLRIYGWVSTAYLPPFPDSLKSLTIYCRHQSDYLMHQPHHSGDLRNLSVEKPQSDDLMHLLPHPVSLKKSLTKKPPASTVSSMLVDGALPASLKELHISGCPQLKEQWLQCHENGGADWSKFSRIPRIRIENKIIQDLPHGW